MLDHILKPFAYELDIECLLHSNTKSIISPMMCLEVGGVSLYSISSSLLKHFRYPFMNQFQGYIKLIWITMWRDTV